MTRSDRSGTAVFVAVVGVIILVINGGASVPGNATAQVIGGCLLLAGVLGYLLQPPRRGKGPVD